MRYFQYDAYDDYGGNIVTVSEEDIRRDYFPIWHKEMCRKYGEGEYKTWRALGFGSATYRNAKAALSGGDGDK